MLDTLERGIKGGCWFSLIDKVMRMDVLRASWKKVAANKGAAGIDRRTVGDFSKREEEELTRLAHELKEGCYQPRAVRRVLIPKPGSAEKRPLGIPCVRDRVVQGALRLVLEPIFERAFAEQSYGFRPRRSAHDALRRVDGLLNDGHTWVVDADLKSYFDTIPHDKLLAKVREHVADGRVLALIESFLKQGVMNGAGEWEPSEGGTPQGGVLSPLLANLYLNGLDHEMARAGVEMVRYADDFVCLCKDEASARAALEKVAQWVAEAGLTLHPEKTRIVDLGQLGAGFDFLGYHFYRSKQGRMKGRLRRRPRIKSVQALKARLKPLMKRNNGRSLEAIIALLRPVMHGWFEYFRHSALPSLRQMDGWVRGRLRSMQRKRHGRRGRAHVRENVQWSNAFFDGLGLFSLEQAWYRRVRSHA